MFTAASSLPSFRARAPWLKRAAVLALVLLAVALTAEAQTPQRVFRVGFLTPLARTADGGPPMQLREAMRSLGYVEGTNLVYESRFAEGLFERLPSLAVELVRLKVDLIAVVGLPATAAAKQASSTIPIVMTAAAGDAVETGFIASLARPGANITGLSDESPQLSAKRMELLKEALPTARKIAILWNANDQGMTLRSREIEKAARRLKVEVQPIGLKGPGDFAAALSAMARDRPDAMFLVADPLTTMNRKQVLEFATSQRIPTMYEWNFIVREGGLMSYGVKMEDTYRIAARYIDRILKGANPADLPAEQPSRYYLTINRKTAAALGLTLPPPLLLRADELLE